MKAKHQRLLFTVLSLCMCAGAVALLLNNSDELMVYYYSPSDLQNNPPLSNTTIRAGGLVVEGSVTHHADHSVSFDITDNDAHITVIHQGVLPSLFREGQGIIAEGTYNQKTLRAESILAKHDEYYMPPEVAASLKDSGRWQGEPDAAADDSTTP